MNGIAAEMVHSPFFGIALTLGAYVLGVWINKKTKIPILNPLFLAMILIIAFLTVFQIDYEDYKIGADYIYIFLVPATVCLAIPIFKKIDILKKNWAPVLAGCAVGAAVSMGSIWLMCDWFGLSDTLTMSLLPKSITTPFGIAVSENLGGIPAITVVCIVITGITGIVLAPFLIKAFRVKDPVARGLAIGTCSHALGTTKALELGETEGAMSGLAISIAGMITVIYSLFLV